MHQFIHEELNPDQPRIWEGGWGPEAETTHLPQLSETNPEASARTAPAETPGEPSTAPLLRDLEKTMGFLDEHAEYASAFEDTAHKDSQESRQHWELLVQKLNRVSETAGNIVRVKEQIPVLITELVDLRQQVWELHHATLAVRDELASIEIKLPELRATKYKYETEIVPPAEMEVKQLAEAKRDGDMEKHTLWMEAETYHQQVVSELNDVTRRRMEMLVTKDEDLVLQDKQLVRVSELTAAYEMARGRLAAEEAHLQTLEERYAYYMRDLHEFRHAGYGEKEEPAKGTEDEAYLVQEDASHTPELAKDASEIQRPLALVALSGVEHLDADHPEEESDDSRYQMRRNAI